MNTQVVGVSQVYQPIPKSPGYWGTVWIEFKKDKLAMTALCVILFLFIVAIFSDFIAGNKPIFLKWNGKMYFPVLFEYKELFNVDFKELTESLPKDNFAVYPPIRYSDTEYDLLSVLSPPSRPPSFWNR